MIKHSPMSAYAAVMENADTTFAEKDRDLWLATYPRRITPPGGYFNPKWYSIMLYAAQTLWFRREHDLLPHTTLTIHSTWLIRRGVPTYFVDREFAEAVLATDPPEGFRFQDLKMPLDSMLFVLPTDFVQENFGWFTPFIGVSRSPAGTYPQDGGELPKSTLDWSYAQRIKQEANMMLFHFPRFHTAEMPADYTGAYRLDQLVSVIADSQFENATIYERRLAGLPLPEKMNDTDADKLEKEEEHEITKRLTTFAVKLLLVLSAAPQHMREGAMTRKPKVKKGKLPREALWSPSMVQFVRKPKERLVKDDLDIDPEEIMQGVKRTPRMHWRKGHMAHVVFGPKDQQIHMSGLPQKDGKVDWENVSQETLDQFWKCHRLDWMQPVLVNKE